MTEQSARSIGEEHHRETALLIERIVGVCLFAALIVAVGMVLRPFVTAILFGGIIVIATWPVHEWLLRKGLSNGAATFVLTAAAIAFVVVPAVFITPRLVRQLADVAPRIQNFINDAPVLPSWVVQMPLLGPRADQLWSKIVQGEVHEIIGPYSVTVRKIIIDLAAALAEGVLQVVLALAIAAMFWLRGDLVRRTLHKIALRFAGRLGGKVLVESAMSIRGVAYGVVGTAVAQAVALTAAFLIAGVPGAGLLGFLSLLVALSQIGILLVLVWGGAAWWLFGQGDQTLAIFIIVWGTFVSLIDNVIRPLLVGYGVTMPLILVLLGVLGGFITFGILGMFIGPTVLAVFVSVVQAWRLTETS